MGESFMNQWVQKGTHGRNPLFMQDSHPNFDKSSARTTRPQSQNQTADFMNWEQEYYPLKSDIQ
jgi:hypothetical protein